MKYIFRYTIYSYWEDNPELTINQLFDALNKVKFPKDKYPINDLIDISRTCIDKLIVSNSNQTSIIIKQQFDQGIFSELDVNQLSQVWENQKHMIYKKLIKNSTMSSNSFDRLSISINSKISNKVQTSKINTYSVFKITSVNAKDNQIKSQFQLTPIQTHQLYQSLKKAQTLIDQVLTEEQ